MGVGEKPEIPEQEVRPSGGRESGNGGAQSGARGKRGRPRRTTARLEAAGVDDGGGRSAPSAHGRAAEAADDGGGDGDTPSRERELRRLLAGLRALDAGDFGIRLEVAGDRLMSEVIDVFNSLSTKQQRLAEELGRVALSVGREGKMRDRATIGPASGHWAGSVDALNSLITDLVQPTSEVARVIRAVAEGDLSQKVELEIEGKSVQGEFFRIGSTVNRMVDQLNAFASEVTRVAREVGTEGRLGGQANVEGVSGTWRDLTDSVNGMATNLTNQVRNIADVTTAVAKGDLSRKITAEAKGEILELKNTINTMVDQLSSFADEVTRVAREVGTEGKLGGQANVPGVAGTWKDLTDSVNSMASNLTSQVRNIADVTTAVAKGDLSRNITAEATGEILELKNTVNTMVDQLSSFASEVTRVAREVVLRASWVARPRCPVSPARGRT